MRRRPSLSDVSASALHSWLRLDENAEFVVAFILLNAKILHHECVESVDFGDIFQGEGLRFGRVCWCENSWHEAARVCDIVDVSALIIAWCQANIDESAFGSIFEGVRREQLIRDLLQLVESVEEFWFGRRKCR
jgi:hypothetical protein